MLSRSADQLVLEFAGREFSELDLWKEYGQDRELGAGGVVVAGAGVLDGRLGPSRGRARLVPARAALGLQRHLTVQPTGGVSATAGSPPASRAIPRIVAPS